MDYIGDFRVIVRLNRNSSVNRIDKCVALLNKIGVEYSLRQEATMYDRLLDSAKFNRWVELMREDPVDRSRFYYFGLKVLSNGRELRWNYHCDKQWSSDNPKLHRFFYRPLDNSILVFKYENDCVQASNIIQSKR